MDEFSKARDAIEKYLRLDISATALRLALGTSFSFERNGSNFSLTGGTETGEPVAVGVDHVRQAIDRVSRGNIGVDALQEWANFILLCDECDIAPYLGDATRRRLTELIHNLASPELFGELTQERLQDFKKVLATFSLE